VKEIVNERIANKEEQTCSVCEVSKTWDHFWVGKLQCRECQLEKRKKQKEERVSDQTTMKLCVCCNIEKPIIEFEVRRKQCKSCVKENKQEYLKSTRAHRTEVTRLYRQNHPEYVKKDLENTKAYNKAHRAEISAKEKERKANDPTFKFKKDMRDKIRHIVKGQYKKGKVYEETLTIVGCDIDFLKNWLSHQFDENMSWDNLGTYWHIDHINPTTSFDLSIEDDIKKCFHWSNTQPLEKTKNMNKSTKIIPELIEEKKKLAEEFLKTNKQ
jgi:hypothetical protein